MKDFSTKEDCVKTLDIAPSVPEVMRKTFVKMTIGLLITALVSFLVVSSPAVVAFIAAHMGVFWALFIVELILVICLSARIESLNPKTAKLIFYVYSAVNGLTLAPIFLIYTPVSITMAFVITAVMFGVTALYGYVTKKDLSGWGSFLFMALIGLIICLVVQFVWHNTMFEFLVSCAAIIIFVGLTAWDTQMIKELTKEGELDPDNISTFGALSLYLDFINLFLHVLKILGNK